MFTIGTIIVTFVVLAAVIHLGDQAGAAVIAAIASIVNAVILVRVRGAQRYIHEDIIRVKDDTTQRDDQILELRSLSVERNRQIVRLERLADRLEVITPHSRAGGRRIYDPPREDD